MKINAELHKNMASSVQIACYLKSIDLEFMPPLSARVDIDAYAEKLFYNSITIEAWADYQLVGLIAGYLNDKSVGFVSSMSVAPSWSRKGLGTLLLGTFIESAIFKGLKGVRLKVHNENHAALQFYKSAGFGETQQCDSDVVMYLELGEVK